MKKFLMGLGIIFSSIILAFIMLIADAVYHDLKMEQELNKELEYVASLIEKNIWDSKIDRILNSNITSKDYIQVEKSIKSYYYKVVTECRSLDRLYESEPLSNILDNIYIDSPDFSITLNFIIETKEELKTLKENLFNLFSKKAIKENMPQNLDEYYEEYYNNLIFDNNDLTKLRNEYKENIEESMSILELYEELYNLLATNQGKWKIEEEIYFNDDALSNKYDDILKRLEKFVIVDNTNKL